MSLSEHEIVLLDITKHASITCNIYSCLLCNGSMLINWKILSLSFCGWDCNMMLLNKIYNFPACLFLLTPLNEVYVHHHDCGNGSCWSSYGFQNTSLQDTLALLRKKNHTRERRQTYWTLGSFPVTPLPYSLFVGWV